MLPHQNLFFLELQSHQFLLMAVKIRSRSHPNVADARTAAATPRTNDERRVGNFRVSFPFISFLQNVFQKKEIHWEMNHQHHNNQHQHNAQQSPIGPWLLWGQQLDPRCTERAIVDFFGGYAPIVNAGLLRNPVHGRSVRTGWCTLLCDRARVIAALSDVVAAQLGGQRARWSLAAFSCMFLNDDDDDY